jgi:acyl-CoA thioesterase-1
MKFIWFCAAGYSFFVGALLFAAAVIFSVTYKKRFRRIIFICGFILSAVLIYLSAATIPFYIYCLWITLAIAWLFLSMIGQKSKKTQYILIITVLGLTLTAVSIELRYSLKPAMPNQLYEKLYIIGDSVTAGIGNKDEVTWPGIIQKKVKADIIDLAQSGATVATVLRQAEQIDTKNALVLCEIGGNDLFGPTPYSEFRSNLNLILQRVKKNGNTVVMLELPLLPWQIEYGRIQRQLANEFNVILIPKRFFAAVLSQEQASSDLAHLTYKGHQLMAEQIWSLIGQNLKASEDISTKNNNAE